MADGVKGEIQILREFIYDYLDAVEKVNTPKEVKQYLQDQIIKIIERLRSWGY